MAASSLRGSIRLTNWEFQPPFVSPPLNHACRLCWGGCEPRTLPALQSLDPLCLQGWELWGSLSGAMPQGELRRSSGMKQNVSDAMNWTSVSSERGEKKEKKKR